MRYYLIVGEASGDLHASHLMQSLKELDSDAEFRFVGGALMAAVGGFVTIVSWPIWVLSPCCCICQRYSVICGCVSTTYVSGNQTV